MFPSYLVPNVAQKFSFNYYTTPGYLFYLYLCMCGCYSIYAFALLLRGHKKHSGIRRNQIRYVLIASVIGFSGGVTMVLSVLSDAWYPVGVPFVFLYTTIITYAIVKHRLMDITIVFTKGVTYVCASLLLLIPLFVLIVYGQQVIFQSINYPFSFFMLVVIVTFAYFFPRVKVMAAKMVEQIIFKNKYNYKKTISDLSNAMVSILSTKDLYKEIITTTTEAMGIEKASIYILDEEKGF